MKRSILVVLAALTAVAPLEAARMGGGVSGGGSHGGGGGFRGGGSPGAFAAGRASAVPSARGMRVQGNSAVTRGIGAQQRVESVPNRFYFHNNGGVRYWHSFRGGLHWYGFHHDRDFFWFPFFAGYWWWWDVNATRWAYWWDGYWWYNGPGGAPYIFVGDSYIPYDQYQQQAPAASGENVASPPSEPPSAPPGAAAANAPSSVPGAEGGAWKSPDGKRMVQVQGADGGAYLFDQSVSPPSFVKFLGGGAEKALFSGGTGGQPLQILLEYKNGGFAAFDADGKPVPSGR